MRLMKMNEAADLTVPYMIHGVLDALVASVSDASSVLRVFALLRQAIGSHEQSILVFLNPTTLSVAWKRESP